jgi:hypothetical protein
LGIDQSHTRSKRPMGRGKELQPLQLQATTLAIATPGFRHENPDLDQGYRSAGCTRGSRAWLKGYHKYTFWAHEINEQWDFTADLEGLNNLVAQPKYRTTIRHPKQNAVRVALGSISLASSL